jgi:hypothetical protein
MLLFYAQKSRGKMNDTQSLDSLYISGTARGALTVAGGTKTEMLEVDGATKTQELDVLHHARIGGDASVCGALHCDNLFHYQSPGGAMIWRRDLLPDTHHADRRRHELGSSTRRWNRVWASAVDTHRINTNHLETTTQRAESIESVSMVAQCTSSGEYLHSFSTKSGADTQGIVTLDTDVTMLNPEGGDCVLTLMPCGAPGRRLEVIALCTLTVILPSGCSRTMEAETSIRLFNTGTEWITFC